MSVIVTQDGYFEETDSSLVVSDQGYFESTISAGTDISAATESLTLTAYSASVSFDVDIPVSTELLTLTTYQASVAASTSISAATELLTLTTYQASVAAGTSISAATEALTLTTYQASIATGSAIDDPYWANVIAMVYGNEANGETDVFVDSSDFNRDNTVPTNVAATNTNQRDGDNNLLFTGSAAGDWLNFPQEGEADLHGSDFTIECNFYIAGDSALDVNSERTAALVSSLDNKLSFNGWSLYLVGNATTTGTGIKFTTWVGNSTYIRYWYGSTVSQNEWHELMCSYELATDTFHMYLDGTEVSAPKTELGSTTLVGNGADNFLKIGGSGRDAIPWIFDGHVEDVRLTRGVARETGASYTPTGVSKANYTHSGRDLYTNFFSYFYLNASTDLRRAVDLTVDTIGGAAWRAGAINDTFFSRDYGKWVYEVQPAENSSASKNVAVGFIKDGGSVNLSQKLGWDSFAWSIDQDGVVRNNNATVTTGATAWDLSTDVVMLMIDIDAGTIKYKVNDNTAETIVTGLSSGTYVPAVSLYDESATFQFRETFTSTIDSGYLEWDAETTVIPISVGTEELVLTTYQAAVNLSSDISVATELLEITTYQASISANNAVSAATESLELTTYQAQVGFSLDISAATESLELATYQATVTTGNNISVAVSTVNLLLTVFSATIEFEGIWLCADDPSDAEWNCENNLPVGNWLCLGDTAISAATEDLVLVTYSASVSVSGGTLQFDLAGYVANGGYTDPTNTIVTKNIPAGSQITAISYTNLSYTSGVDTYMDNIVLSVSDGQGDGDVVYWDILPGVDGGAPNQQGTWPVAGTQSGSWADPGPYGGGPFTVQPSGDVRMAVYDDTGFSLQTIISGTVTVTYI